MQRQVLIVRGAHRNGEPFRTEYFGRFINSKKSLEVKKLIALTSAKLSIGSDIVLIFDKIPHTTLAELILSS